MRSYSGKLIVYGTLRMLTTYPLWTRYARDMESLQIICETLWPLSSHTNEVGAIRRHVHRNIHRLEEVL